MGKNICMNALVIMKVDRNVSFCIVRERLLWMLNPAYPFIYDSHDFNE